MENIIDESFIDNNVSVDSPVYAGFWKRVFSGAIDSVLISIFNYSVLSLNLITLKSVILIIVVNKISLFYRPIMEYKYGATLGKMIFKIKVVNVRFDKLNLKEILFRNSIYIFISFFILIFSINSYSKLNLEATSNVIDYFQKYKIAGKKFSFVNYVIYVVYLIEIIFLLTDKFKRTLHDRIASTYVISSK